MEDRRDLYQHTKNAINKYNTKILWQTSCSTMWMLWQLKCTRWGSTKTQSPDKWFNEPAGSQWALQAWVVPRGQHLYSRLVSAVELCSLLCCWRTHEDLATRRQQHTRIYRLKAIRATWECTAAQKVHDENRKEKEPKMNVCLCCRRICLTRTSPWTPCRLQLALASSKVTAETFDGFKSCSAVFRCQQKHGGFHKSRQQTPCKSSDGCFGGLLFKLLPRPPRTIRTNDAAMFVLQPFFSRQRRDC